MKKLVYTLIFSLLPSLGIAQGLPANVCETLKQERAKYGTTVTREEIGKILNATAWRYYTQIGMGKKDSGTTCVAPNGVSIACDILVSREPNVMWDIMMTDLADGTIVGVVTCAAGQAPLGDPARIFVEATVPEGVKPKPPPPPTCNLEAVMEELRILEQNFTAVFTALGILQQEQAALRASLEEKVNALQARPFPDYVMKLPIPWGRDRTIVLTPR